MKKRLISLMATVLALLSANGQGHVGFDFIGGAEENRPIEITPAKSTGLDKIFVVYDKKDVTMSYTSVSDEPAVWCTYDYQNGVLQTDTLSVTYNGNVSTLSEVQGDKGYIILDGTDRYYYWVVNYADHYLSLNSIYYTEDPVCSLLKFTVDGSGSNIYFYTTDGARQILDREIKLKYDTKTWEYNENEPEVYPWQPDEVIETFESLDETIEISPPFWNTTFVLSGDRFLEKWHKGLEIPTSYYRATAVESRAIVIQDRHDNQKKFDGGYGDSAPCHIVFTGYPTEAVTYHVWQMATDEEFEDIIYEDTREEVDYTFEETGSYYMRFLVRNDETGCESAGETYRIFIGESALDCPNVFSPGTTPEVNDIWKVSYKSLVEFHCWIFNRWGALVYEYTDPAGGWDGTYRGKLVDPGVYYYVITATGIEGKSYRKRGAITIIRYKRGGSSNSSTDMGG